MSSWWSASCSPGRPCSSAAGSARSTASSTASAAAGDDRPVATPAQRALVVRQAIAACALNGLGRSARFAGFADALLHALAELESGLLDPAELDGDLALLHGAYRHELDRLGLRDRGLVRRGAVERLASDLDAWNGEPVFAYGFEDLTGAEWGLLEALAGRTDVTVSLPYEPGPAGVRLAAANGRRPLRARRRPDRGAVAALRRGRPTRPRAPGARALLRLAASARGVGRRGPLPRGRRHPRRTRAARRGGARPAPRRDAAGGDRGRVPERRALARPARDGVRRARNPVRGRRRGPSRPDAPGQGAARIPALRLARRRAAGALRLSALAVLGRRAARGRLRRGTAARPCGADAGAGARGDRAPARRTGPGSRGAGRGGGPRRRQCERR